MLTLWAVQFDLTVHLSDIITTVVVPLAGWAGLKAYRSISRFYSDVGQIGDMVDEHTDVLIKSGWAKGKELPYVGPTKRRMRRMLGL